MITLHDIYIGGQRPITQHFGENPANYAKFGLKGHDGIDIAMDNGTPVLSATQGIIVKAGTDPGGYGNFIEVWDDKQDCATIYGHLQKVIVNMNDRVAERQRIGLSNNTGNSTGPHLHFGLCLTDKNGMRLNRNNGYAGWVNPEDTSICTWDTNGQEWVNPIPTVPLIDQVRIQRDQAYQRLESIRELATGDGHGGPNPVRL